MTNKKVINSRLILIITIYYLFLFLVGVHSSQASEARNKVINSSDLIFISDSDHTNYKRLTSMFSILIEDIVSADSRYNCIFVEADHVIYGPAIRDYMSGQKTYEDSVLKARIKWQKLTKRNFIKAPKEFLDSLKNLGVKVLPMDWDDSLEISKRMSKLFDAGFKGDDEKLREAFRIGVDVRNEHMAENIKKHMQTDFNKGVVIAGSLHMTQKVEMDTGVETYTSIGQFPALKNMNQSMIEVIDCSIYIPEEMQNDEIVKQCEKLKLGPTKKTLIRPFYQGVDVFFAGSTQPTDMSLDLMGGVASPKIFERWVIR